MRHVVVSRPDMPGYGIKAETEGQGLYEWRYVSGRMAESRNYWVCTTRPGGRPHSAPVWGVWLDEVLYFGSNPTSVKGRNLAGNPAISVHLESGDEVVILEGVIKTFADAEPTFIERLTDAYEAKYAYRPPNVGEEGWYKVEHGVVLAWSEQDFPSTATRWLFSATD